MAEEVATNLVGRVVDSLFGVAKKEISYMWNCTENVEKLRNEAKKLKHTRGRFEKRTSIAKDKGEDLLDGVQEWLDNADAHISMAEEFLEEEDSANKMCFNLRLCVNLDALHHYGKMARNKASSLLQHQEDGKIYESFISIPIPGPGLLDLYQRKNLADIDTHKLALEKIVKSMKDESIQIIGIYGIGGVGKTTLAKEVAAATVNTLFADVVFIIVSQRVDVAEIKKEAEAAAKRIMKGEKILIILDDVWRELKLDELGIPCGIDHMNCKILLTSRKRDVCVAMNAQSEICVDSLLVEEAWIIFKHVVGERVETDAKLKQIAMKVVEGCGGLPLIIQAVGKALKNESIKSWETALDQLKEHAPSNIDPDIELAFTHLQLSYDYLESEVAKSCFLLCSMFTEDSLIPLERLTYYGMGLNIFKDLHSMEDARNKVRLAVKILKSSCLLLDGNDEMTTKMHDVVREVALLIASKHNKFLVEAGKDLTEWQPRNQTVESCRGISLMQNNICELPDYELRIPLLDIFLIQNNHNLSTFSDEFIHGVKKAKVLDIEHNNIVSLPLSLKLLTSLLMLNLGGNKSLEEISILGELKDLEILILNDTGIKEIPREIGQLVNLRRLEVKRCHGLSHIAPAVISKLRWLEELHIGYYPVEEGNYNSLVELGKLTKLTFLDLFVPHIYLIPEVNFFERSKGFVVQVGGREQIYDDLGVVHKKILILGMSDLDISPLMHVKNLIEVCDGFVLESIANINNIMPMMHFESFNHLKTIMLSRCDDLVCLVEDSMNEDQMQTFHSPKNLDGGKAKKMLLLKMEHLVLLQLDRLNVIWNCPDQYISFNNLVTFKIVECSKLARLFSVTVARSLVNLQKLTISDCRCLKEVIWDGDIEETGDGEIDVVVQATHIVFPCLVQITLHDLGNLTSFYPGNSIIKYPSLVKVTITDCARMDKWGYGIHDTPKLKFVNNVIEPSTIDDGLEKYRKLVSTDLTEKIRIMRRRFVLEFISGERIPIFRYHILQAVGLKDWSTLE